MIKALATDLDGTLIPLDEASQQQQDLRVLERELREREITLLFVTGRHADSAIAAIEQSDLPTPDSIICNVGTTILKRDGDEFQNNQDYAADLRTITSGMASDDVHGLLEDLIALRKQESFKQSEFKLSYYTNANGLSEISEEVRSRLLRNSAPWDVIASVDPFNGDGLIDVLPLNVSKSHAISWWATRHQFTSEHLLFAGDSGNDIAALTAGWKAILVGNATAEVVQEAKRRLAEQKNGGELYCSSGHATSGVLEGLRHFSVR